MTSRRSSLEIAVVALSIIALVVGILLLLNRPQPAPVSHPTPLLVVTVTSTSTAIPAAPTAVRAPTDTAVPAPATATALPVVSPEPRPSPDPAAQAVGAWTSPRATKSADCQYRRAANGAALPDPACTTGATDPRLPAATLCAHGFSTTAYRDGPLAMPAPAATYHAQILAEYRAAFAALKTPGSGEDDHLISLELGGDNDPANRWEQPPDMPAAPGWQTKDKVENALHAAVCAGQISLADAQQRIATDWTSALP